MRLNPNLAKIHRSYLVEDVAEIYGVHKNTVRGWVKQGLAVNDDRRPMLILGIDLRKFLQHRNKESKRPCKSHEMYCLKCRKPQPPAGGMVDYEPINEKTGRFIGICPACDTMINRFGDLSKISAISRFWEVSLRGMRNV